MARGHQIENSTGEIYFRVISNNDTRGALLFLGAIDFPVGFGGVHYLCDQVVHAVSAKWGHLHVAVRSHRRRNFLTLLWRDRGTVENLSKVEKHVNNALYNGISSYEKIWCLKKDLASTKNDTLQDFFVCTCKDFFFLLDIVSSIIWLNFIYFWTMI